MQGKPLGLLHGIPFAAKDLVNTAGVRTTFGSLLHEDNVPKEDAVAAARMKPAGAILFGKTTTPEFGHKALTDAPLFGRTRNAWSAEHTSGGSSGGAAVAVAAGIGPIGIATDGGGSTRIPAAANGMVGLKQSNGVIPHSQVADAFGNYTYVTPMTRTVMDTALMLQAMAGPHPVRSLVDRPRAAGLHRGGPARRHLKGKRILFSATLRQHDGGQGRARGLRARARQARASWAPNWSSSTSELPDMEPVWKVINHTTWRARFDDMIRRDGNRMTPSLVRQVAMAAEWSGADYQRAMFQRTELFRMVQRWFETADYLVTPTLSRTALPIDQDLFEPISDRRRRGGRAPAQLVPLHHAVQHHRPSGAHAVLRLRRARGCRSACRSSAASATRPRCCARRRSTKSTEDWLSRWPDL